MKEKKLIDNYSNKNTLKRLLSYFKKYKYRFIVVIISIIISALSQVVMQTFIKRLIDHYIEPLIGIENPIFTDLINAILIVSFICLLGVVASFIYTRIMVKISQGILKDIRNEMFRHMQTLPLEYFDTHSYGDVMSRFTNDTDALRQMLSQSIPQFISSFVTIIGTLIAMLYLNPLLTFVVILGVIVMLCVTKSVASKSGKYFIDQQKSIGKLNGFVEEMIVGQKVIKVFTHEEEIKRNFDNFNNDLKISTTNANMYANTLMPIMMNIGYIIYVVVAIVGALLALSGLSVITLGTIAAFLTLTRSFTNPISQISQQLNSIVMAFAGARRIFNLIDEKSEENQGSVILVNAKIDNGKIKETNKNTGIYAWKKDRTFTKVEGNINLCNVKFSYNKEKTVLKGIDINAKSGEKIAFVGSTGAGKTTITNLLNRFYEVEEGVINYDGVNIKEIDKSSLRKSLGMVLQDPNLFTGTVLENIKYGKNDVTRKDVIRAAKIANAHSFIKFLPNGYDTVIKGNGSNLSGGEKQLLTIARALLLNSPVMILDEATSSIDSMTEKLVHDAMDKLMEGRTTFVIAHRLSTIKNADVIMVLDQGKIIEKGTHKELMKERGRYFELYKGFVEK